MKDDPTVLLMLMRIHSAVRDMAEAAEQAAEVTEKSGASGIAFALHMLRESLLAYSTAVSDYFDREP